MSVLVVGGVFREVFSPTPTDTHRVRLAGSALYAALAAARLGAEVTMLAPVGAEDVELAGALACESGVDPRLIATEGASGTFAYERLNGTDQLRAYRPAEGDLDPEAVPLPDLDFSHVLVFGHPQWDPWRTHSVREAVTGSELLFDRQGWLSRTRSAAASLNAPAATRILLQNYGERLDELGSAATHFDQPATGFTAEIVKDGRWGVHLLKDSHSVAFPAFRSKVVGDLGSGDIFAGALLASLNLGTDISSAIPTAIAAASVAIADPEGLPSQDFSDRVAQTLKAGSALPLLPPRSRLAAVLRLECSEDPLGLTFAAGLQGDLALAGFAATELKPSRNAEFALCHGSSRLPLISGSVPRPLSEVLDWLSGELA